MSVLWAGKEKDAQNGYSLSWLGNDEIKHGKSRKRFYETKNY